MADLNVLVPEYKLFPFVEKLRQYVDPLDADAGLVQSVVRSVRPEAVDQIFSQNTAVIYRVLDNLRGMYNTAQVTAYQAPLQPEFYGYFERFLNNYQAPDKQPFEVLVNKINSIQGTFEQKGWVAETLLAAYQQQHEFANKEVNDLLQRTQTIPIPQASVFPLPRTKYRVPFKGFRERGTKRVSVTSGTNTESIETASEAVFEEGQNPRKAKRAKTTVSQGPEGITISTQTEETREGGRVVSETFTPESLSETQEKPRMAPEIKNFRNAFEREMRQEQQQQPNSAGIASEQMRFPIPDSPSKLYPSDSYNFLMGFRKSYKRATQKDVYEYEFSNPVISEIALARGVEYDGIINGFRRDAALGVQGAQTNLENAELILDNGITSNAFAWGCIYWFRGYNRAPANPSIGTPATIGRVQFTHGPFLNESVARGNASAVLAAPLAPYREAALAYGYKNSSRGCPWKDETIASDLVWLLIGPASGAGTVPKSLLMVNVPWTMDLLDQLFEKNLPGVLESRSLESAQRLNNVVSLILDSINDVIRGAIDSLYPQGFNPQKPIITVTRACGFPLESNPTTRTLRNSDTGIGFTVLVFDIDEVENPLKRLIEFDRTIFSNIKARIKTDLSAIMKKPGGKPILPFEDFERTQEKQIKFPFSPYVSAFPEYTNGEQNEPEYFTESFSSSTKPPPPQYTYQSTPPFSSYAPPPPPPRYGSTNSQSKPFGYTPWGRADSNPNAGSQQSGTGFKPFHFSGYSSGTRFNSGSSRPW
jgi:hypothetical protein